VPLRSSRRKACGRCRRHLLRYQPITLSARRCRDYWLFAGKADREPGIYARLVVGSFFSSVMTLMPPAGALACEGFARRQHPDRCGGRASGARIKPKLKRDCSTGAPDRLCWQGPRLGAAARVSLPGFSFRLQPHTLRPNPVQGQQPDGSADKLALTCTEAALDVRGGGLTLRQRPGAAEEGQK
jgi:hypothetical protein